MTDDNDGRKPVYRHGRQGAASQLLDGGRGRIFGAITPLVLADLKHVRVRVVDGAIRGNVIQ